VLTSFAGSLTLDPRSWPSILLLGFPTPGLSQFREVHTIPAASVVRLVAGKWSLFTSEVDIQGEAADFESIIEKLRLGIPMRTGGTYTLSGGWDSRLLLGIAAGQGRRRINAWTTSPDDGLDLDLSFARGVAETLRVNHHELVPDEDSWPGSARRAMTRMNHATWQHVWLEPLASSLRRPRRKVVDGIGGDVLFKGLLQVAEDDSSGASVVARRRLWQRLGGRYSDNADVWSSEARRLFTEVGFDEFDKSVRGMRDAPGWQTLAILTTRTARGIACSPLRLFGPEAEVFMPFVRLPVLRQALGPSVHPHRSKDFYRKLLESVIPVMATLPSTNDGRTDVQPITTRRSTHPKAIAAVASMIAHDESALGLLGEGLRSAVALNDITALTTAMRWHTPTRALHAAYCYASWRSANPLVQGDLFDGH
jgi:Asparagine synthase